MIQQYFLDIDDTLIVPQSITFRAPPYNKMIDEIKQNKDSYSNYEEIISNWRLRRKVILIDENWPEVLNRLEKNLKFMGLLKWILENLVIFFLLKNGDIKN